MTPERWNEVRREFDRLALLDEDARVPELAALSRHDPALAAELSALFVAEARDPDRLRRPVPIPAAVENPERGRRIGAWELLEPLGEGGMGRVFLARRADHAFDKRVAVKLVHAELLSPWMRERFASERQALAVLEHPGIARLIDGGESESGEPYLVLEFVEGRPLPLYASERRLSFAARIELFLQVLSAVAHAHRHLIVHRDLKPANILVTADGEVKLLDFGIAKILAPEAGASADATRTALRALTPEYASPEQVLGGVTTTATDIYALGVILFELLTGRRPYRVPTGAPEEWAEAALHQEVAAAPELKGDLEAIVGRAMRKNPAERYSTADAFADDLNRFQAGRPVAARRGNFTYRAAKFVRRNRAALAASGLAAALLLATIAVAGARLKRERDRAAIEAQTAESVSSFLATLFQKADPVRTRGARLTAREILDQGAQRIERDLAGQPAVQAKLLTVLGAVERDLGLLDEARPLLERALALREAERPGEPLALAETLLEVGTLDRMQGELERAQARLERALALREATLGPDDPETARALSALGLLYRGQGDLDRARPRLERALGIAREASLASAETGRWLNHLGLVHQDAGDYEQARQAFAESLEILERGEGPDSPLPAFALDNLGTALRQLGRPAEALPVLERARELVERTWGMDHPQRGNALNSLGATLSDLGRREEAIVAFEGAATVYVAALGAEHPNVAWPLRNQAEALLGLGRPAEAVPLFKRALAIRRAAYGEAHPDVAQSLTDLGMGYAALGELDPAERWLREGLSASRAALEPTSAGLGEAMALLADLLVRRGKLDEARALYAEALPIYRASFPPGDARILEVEAAIERLALRPKPPS